MSSMDQFSNKLEGKIAGESLRWFESNSPYQMKGDSQVVKGSDPQKLIQY